MEGLKVRGKNVKGKKVRRKGVESEMICWLFGKSESKREKKEMNLVKDINNPMLMCYSNNFQ